MRDFTKTCLVMLFALLASAPMLLGQTEGDYVQITGKVVDSLTSAPLRGVSIAFPYDAAETGVTDKNGVFSFQLKKERAAPHTPIKIKIDEIDYEYLDGFVSIGQEKNLKTDIKLMPLQRPIVNGKIRPFQNWVGSPCCRVPYKIRIRNPQGGLLYEDKMPRYDLDFNIRNIDFGSAKRFSLTVVFENSQLFAPIERHNNALTEGGLVTTLDIVCTLQPAVNSNASIDLGLGTLEMKMLEILKSRTPGNDFSSDVKPLYYSYVWLIEYAMHLSQNSPRILQAYKNRRNSLQELYAAYFKSYVDELNKDLINYCHQNQMEYCYDPQFLYRDENQSLLKLFGNIQNAYLRWFEVIDCPSHDQYVESYREEYRRVSQALIR